MEAQASSSPSQAQYLETELTEMLPNVVLEMSDVNEHCIYKVPQRFREGNPKFYTPRVVSIGPFHKPRDPNGENNTLKRMEELKLEYLKRLLNRNKQLKLKNLFESLIAKEKSIRSCYAEPVDCNSNEFLTMILVDACFIIEYFLRRYTGLVENERDLLSEPLMEDDIFYDLTLLENQLPFFVLEDIFNSTNVLYVPFLHITFHYFQMFNCINTSPNTIKTPKHFTDLLRTFMKPISQESLEAPKSRKAGYMVKHLPSASQLSEVGLVFKASSSKSLFDLKYHHPTGVMEMPLLNIEDRTEPVFRNILAFEQCHYILSPDVTQYLFLLYFLINTEKDVNILIDKKIVVNWMGDANAVVKMFNSLGSNVMMPYMSEEYCSLYDDLIEFHENPRNKHMAILYHEYFNTPWKKASTTAAVLLLLFTLIQTICSVISLV